MEEEIIASKKLTNSEKAKLLNELIEKAEDSDPVWINLFKPELLPWGGMTGTLIPSRGTLVKVVKERDMEGKFAAPTGIIVDLTRMKPMPELPYTKLPLKAVIINDKDEVWVDCRLAVEAGIGLGLNNFESRNEN